MKVAYIFKNNMASTFQLATTISYQLEQNIYGVDSAPSKNMIEVGQAGCFPQRYSALGGNMPNLVITL